MVKNLSQSDKNYPRYYNFNKILHFFNVQFFSREIIQWHEIARTGFLKSKIIFSQ